MTHHHIGRVLGLAAVVLGLGVGTAHGLEIEQMVWGFDGQIVLHRFNPLSVLVFNPSADPFDGRLELRQMMNAGARVGAVLVEPDVYIAPFSRRWVQFYPYAVYEADEWVLSWGRRSGERIDVPRPQAGQAAWIVLYDVGDPRRRTVNLKRLRDDLFPPTVAATDGLAVVALAHVPRWESARRQALLDWLHAGGRLHLFQDEGRFPQFTEELALLNSPLERQRIGAGTVYRHARSLDGINMAFLRRAMGQDTEPAAPGQDPNDQYNAWEIDQGFFSTLKGMTRPNHSWGLIHLLSLAYLALVFPGCWLLGGRRRADYRLNFAFLIALVALFSWIFSLVGRRGYNEATTVQSVAIARPLAGGGFDLTGWTNAFVTDGDDYRIEHAGTGRLYSTCQAQEAVNGLINNGLDGTFLVDIPPYSSRPFGYRVKGERNPIPVQVEQWPAGETLEGLTVSLGADLADPSQLIVAAALHRDRYYTVQRENGRYRLTGPGQPLGQVLRLEQYASFRFGMYYDPWGNSPPPSAEVLFGELMLPLVARDLGLERQSAVDRFSLADDRVRLFVYAPMPDAFFVKNPAFGRQMGRVLYCFDLFPPETP